MRLTGPNFYSTVTGILGAARLDPYQHYQECVAERGVQFDYSSAIYAAQSQRSHTNYVLRSRSAGKESAAHSNSTYRTFRFIGSVVPNVDVGLSRIFIDVRYQLPPSGLPSSGIRMKSALPSGSSKSGPCT